MSGATPPKPRFRGRIHQAAFLLTIPAGAVLIASARRPVAYVAAAIYAASMAALFGTSATYHRGDWNEKWRSLMQRLDHAMIFVLIAGTFTPLALVAMGAAWGITFLALVWTVAAVGVTLSIVRFDIIDRHDGLFYIGFGWMAVIALPAALGALTAGEIICLVVGGVLYTLGAIGFVLERPNPRPQVFGYHEVWHAMTVAAAGFHFAFVLQLVNA